ncbi:MAG: hypothetical protein KKB30_01340 [Proteobacteria bacterium]|nr:hypothetical protein [Pseudomonadota bacterium]MBU1714259.1 hypothetical protein [Pseudomonadota bacterium]
MGNRLLVSLLCGLWLILVGDSLFAATVEEQAHIQKHAEEMKFKSPMKYMEMTQRTGGNITRCLDCHVEIAERALHLPGRVEN